MKLPRRQLLRLAAGAAALSVVPRPACAQSYPTRPVHIIVPFGPAGAADILARLIGQWLSERLGQPFIIDNRPGASTNIGTETVVRASPDGYTLLMFSTSAAINATLYEKLNFEFIRDIAPVTNIMRGPSVMEINPSVPATTVPDFIAYAKANPGKIDYASGGNGTTLHLCGELFKTMAGIDMVHVPYRSGEPSALIDLIGDRVQVMFGSVATAIPHIKTGELRALAVTTATRSDVMPNVPTISEFLPGFEASNWQGVGAPSNTPTEIIDKLYSEIKMALADPKVKDRITGLGGTVVGDSPADFSKFVADETEKWGKVIRAANIKPD